ncbi:MAG: glycosyltransferase [Saprospiraceae bacterium]|nr:glycosyltransferase [Saprospiraceae bacterium]
MSDKRRPDKPRKRKTRPDKATAKGSANPQSSSQNGASAQSKEERIKWLENHIQQLEQAKQKKQDKIDELSQVIREKEAETRALKASWSYRLGHYTTLPFRRTWSIMQRLLFGRAMRKREERAHYDLLSQSTYFDQDYYLNENPDVRDQGLDPVWHYLLFGEAEGRSPSRLFDVAFYRKAYPDVDLSNMNALLHFLKYGRREGRLPRPDENKKNIARPFEVITPSDALILDVDPPGPYDKWVENNAIGDALRKDLETLQARLAYRPLISVVMPVYNVRKKWLRKAVKSVQSQIYAKWELCIADDASTASHVRPYLEKLSGKDRIRVTFLEQNAGISAATNAALQDVQGEFVVFLDNDDELTEDALLEIALALNQDQEIDVLYSDEDKIDQHGHQFGAFFKPDWSPELLISYNYFNKLLCVRTELITQVGGLRSAFDGAQDYDLILRVTDRARKVHHIPRVLYHWRALPGSIAGDGDAKSDSHHFFDKCRAALQDFLDTKGIPARAFHPDFAREHQLGLLHVEWPHEGPLVSIIIPSKDHHELLERCITSLAGTNYPNYEIIIADNASEDADTLAYLDDLRQRDGIRVVVIPNKGESFSYAAINNEAVGYAEGDLICFLNDDTEVINPDWLSQMVGYLSLESVGVVGAKLRYPDGSIQHAGILNGMYQHSHSMLPVHAWRNLPEDELGYGYFVKVSRNYTAVTAACMLIEKSLFEECGGFDEELFPISYNDIDLCLKVCERGQRIAFVQEAELTHYESQSRSRIITTYQDVVNFKRKYRSIRDPYYNPNHSKHIQYQLCSANTRDYDLPLDRKPMLMAVTHNLNLEGAPLVLYEVCAGLADRGDCDIEVYAPEEGPLREYYEQHGITVHVFPSPVTEIESYENGLLELSKWLKERKADVVIANTLNTFYAHEASHQAGIPSIWSIHESVDVAEYFNAYPPAVRKRAIGSFVLPYALVFAAKATRILYHKVRVGQYFPVINYGLKRDKIDAYCAKHSRAAARRKLNLRDDQVMILNLGTICERKGQLDFVRAAIKAIEQGNTDCYYVLVGARRSHNYTAEYLMRIEHLIEQYKVSQYFLIIDETSDVHPFYRAADIFVCSSHNESYPRVVLEAMIYGLPIISTDAYGIKEQVAEFYNAWLYPPGESDKLCTFMMDLSADPAKRKEMGTNSRECFELINTYDEMVDQYLEVIRGGMFSKYNG